MVLGRQFESTLKSNLFFLDGLSLSVVFCWMVFSGLFGTPSIYLLSDFGGGLGRQSVFWRVLGRSFVFSVFFLWSRKLRLLWKIKDGRC